MNNLPLISQRVSQVYQFLQNYQQKHGYAPSLPEIRDGTDIKSLRGVTIQLDKLVKSGLIFRNKNARRSIQIINKRKQIARIPLVGEIHAGEPILAEQNIEEYRDVPLELLHGRQDAFLLKVKGTSMNRAGYFPGDIVIVLPTQVANNGDIVVAFTPEENSATLKKFKMMDGYFLLIPQSDDPQYKPFIGKGFKIQGRVIGKLQ